MLKDEPNTIVRKTDAVLPNCPKIPETRTNSDVMMRLRGIIILLLIGLILITYIPSTNQPPVPAILPDDNNQFYPLVS